MYYLKIKKHLILNSKIFFENKMEIYAMIY